jgi:hypothetical protein
MPDELHRALRAAADAIAEGTNERDRLIREAHDIGCSLRHIGQAVNLSHAGVAKIIRRRA